MGATALGRDDAAVHVNEFVAGYASAATRAAYASDLSLWLGHCCGQSRGLFEVRRADIEGYARDLEAQGLAPATVNRRLATITGFYRWALDEGMVTGNPAGNVRRPRRPSDSPRGPVPHRAEGLARRRRSRERPRVCAGVPAGDQRAAGR